MLQPSLTDWYCASSSAPAVEQQVLLHQQAATSTAATQRLFGPAWALEALGRVTYGAALAPIEDAAGPLCLILYAPGFANHLVATDMALAFSFYTFESQSLVVVHAELASPHVASAMQRAPFFEVTLPGASAPAAMGQLLGQGYMDILVVEAGFVHVATRRVALPIEVRQSLGSIASRHALNDSAGEPARLVAAYHRAQDVSTSPILSEPIILLEPELPVPEPLPVVGVAIAAAPPPTATPPPMAPSKPSGRPKLAAPRALRSVGARLLAASKDRRVAAALIAVTALLAVIVGLLVWPTGNESKAQATAPSQVPPQPAKRADRQLVSPTKKRKPKAELNPWIHIRPPRNRALVLGLPKGHTGDGFHYQRSIRPPAQPYSMQQHEVTWKEVEPWLERNAPVQRPPGAADDEPATGLDWKLAYDYCRSIGGRLPTEEQWEFAARGMALRKFSWGDRRLDLQLTHVYAGEAARPRPVKSSDQDVTPEGIHDLIGNAQEWTADLWRASEPDGDERWVQAGGRSFRAVRGLPLDRPAPDPLPEYGAAFREPLCSRGDCISATAMRTVGFRCVKEPS